MNMEKNNIEIGSGVSRELGFLETDREIMKSVVETTKRDYAEQFKDTAKLRQMVASTQSKPIKKTRRYRFSEWFRNFVYKFRVLTGVEQ